ncbi:MAG: gamma-glutamyl-gamma-aminobutyrate hydrolase family protein, partial [Halanaerobiales bacterium]
LLNIFFGGKNYQDIKLAKDKYFSHDISNLPRWYDVHSVKLKKNSKLALAYKSNVIKTNSLHHQSIKDLGDGLTATAWSEDGIIEGAELKNKDFVVGVQWHPEMMYYYSEIHLQLFKYFINEIKSNGDNLGGVK